MFYQIDSSIIEMYDTYIVESFIFILRNEKKRKKEQRDIFTRDILHDALSYLDHYRDGFIFSFYERHD